jgi:hypothetical protein
VKELSISRSCAIDFALGIWLLATFAVAVLPRELLLNGIYSFVSLALLISIYSNVSRGFSRFFGFALSVYLAATVLPLLASLMNGDIALLYYWLLGINTLFAVQCFAYIPMKRQKRLADILIAACFIFVGVFAIDDRLMFEPTSILGGSTNLLSAALITVVCWYCFVRMNVDGKAPIGIPVALFVFAVFLGGRSGIVISAGVLLTSAFFSALSSRAVGFTVFGMILMSVFFIPDDFFVDLIAGTRLIHGFEDDTRSAMISEYFQELDARGLVFGQSYDTSGLIMSYGGNPHNSFIRAHHLFGILPLLLAFGLGVGSVFIFLMRPSRVFLYGMILGTLVFVRAFFDSVLFWFELDFAMVVLFFGPLLSYDWSRHSLARRSTRVRQKEISA